MRVHSTKTTFGLLLVGLSLGFLALAAQAAAPVSSAQSSPMEEAAYFDHRGLMDFSAQQVEAPARALILDGSTDESLVRVARASELSPELPLVHFALAGERVRRGEYAAAFQAGLRGVAALPDHVEGRFWWMGSLGVMLALMMIATSLTFVFLVGLSFFRHAAHDLGDLFSPQMPTFARVALLSSCLLLPLALGEGLLGLSCGFFVIGVLYGRSVHRTTLALAVVILATGTFVVTDWAGRAADALDADPVASSSLALVRGRATPAQLAILEYAADSKRDGLAMRSLAIQAGRRGDEAELRQRLQVLLELEKNDPMALILLGNLAFRSGDSVEALRLYHQAGFRGNSFELFFNQAQAHAKSFQIQQFEEAMARAQALDSERATHLTSLGRPDLVLDPAFPMFDVGERLWLASDGSPWSHLASARVAPGWLGVSPVNLLGVFSLLWLGAFGLRGRYEHAGHCKRCGKTICARCDTSLWSNEICDSCHFLFSRPRAADPRLRNQRIQSLWVRERRVGQCLDLLSVCLPGFAGIRVRRPDLALVSIFLFAGALVFWIFRDGPFPEPWVTGEAVRWILASLSGFFLTAYLVFLWVGFSIHRRA